MSILKSFSINCSCTSEKSMELDDEIIKSISDYYDVMEDCFYNTKLPENDLLDYFYWFVHVCTCNCDKHKN